MAHGMSCETNIHDHIWPMGSSSGLQTWNFTWASSVTCTDFSIFLPQIAHIHPYVTNKIPRPKRIFFCLTYFFQKHCSAQFTQEGKEACLPFTSQVYIFGLFAQNTVVTTSLEVIKCKYDWSAAKQWQCCLWDGLWLCQELAAKSIDPNGVAVRPVNSLALMYLSCLKKSSGTNVSLRQKPQQMFSL